MTFRATSKPVSDRRASALDRSAPTVAARMVARTLALASRKGVDADALARAAGVDVAVVSDPDGRVPVIESDALLEALDRAAGGPSLGLELALTRDPETYDAAGVVLLAAPTLRAGFDRAFRCQTLWGDGERFRREGDVIVFDPAPRGDAHRRAHEIVTECALVEVGFAARFVAPSAPPVRVELAYDAADRVELLAGTIGAPVRSGAKRSTIVLSREALDAPMPPAAFDALGLVPPEDLGSLGARVRAATARATIVGDASLVTVADRLGVPPRTLQRKLAEEGATFGAIVEAERERLARGWLRAGLSIREIGGLLGYADKAAFYRAFRRWTGTTPHEARVRAPSPALRSERP